MLITEEYRRQNELMHNGKQFYGVCGKAFIPLITHTYLDYDCHDILDYGSGKGTISKRCPNINIRNYDPAIPEFSADPEPADMVVCIDVMEHVEPDCLEEVLVHISSLMKNVGIINVSLRKARKNLPDGRNTHLIVEEPEWWLPKFMKHFRLREYSRSDDAFYVVVYK